MAGLRSRRAVARAARRAHDSGSGPTLPGQEPTSLPGASSSFAMFGEVMLTGVMVTLASLPVVTLPSALAAGRMHLAGFVRGEKASWADFWAEYRASLRGGLVVGAAAALLAFILVSDIVLARSGALPGGQLIEVVGWLGLASLITVVPIVAGSWGVYRQWRPAVLGLGRVVVGDPPGTFLHLVAATLVVFLGWVLVPLVIPALGCLAFALVAIPLRPRKS